jgi:hypothetical protein
MKVFAAVVIVSAVWVMFAFVLGGCAGRKRRAASQTMPGSLGDAGGAPWMWEQHGTVVSLGQAAVVPAGHPLFRVGARPPSDPRAAQ